MEPLKLCQQPGLFSPIERRTKASRSHLGVHKYKHSYKYSKWYAAFSIFMTCPLKMFFFLKWRSTGVGYDSVQVIISILRSVHTVLKWVSVVPCCLLLHSCRGPRGGMQNAVMIVVKYTLTSTLMQISPVRYERTYEHGVHTCTNTHKCISM